MRKMIVKKKCVDENDLKYWIRDILSFAGSEFGWDNFVASGHIEDNYHVLVVVEK